MKEDKCTIWLLDDRQIRRSAIAGFISNEHQDDHKQVMGISTLDDLPDHAPDKTHPELCLFVTGSTSLSDPDLRRKIETLLKALQGRPLAVFADIDSEHEVAQAIELGLHGLISTNMEAKVALAALDFILLGGSFFQRSSLADLVEGAPLVPHTGQTRECEVVPEDARQMGQRPSSRHLPDLTARQVEIVEMLKLGRANKEIARNLGISDATVKIFVRQVLKKFGASNRTQVALLAAQAMSPNDVDARSGQPPQR